MGLAITAPIRGESISILMLHRFRTPDDGVDGHDPVALGRALEYLRRKKYELMSLNEVVALLERGERPKRNSVVFTVDDGYFDFSVAAPVFSSYDCPVTVFLVTDFVSGKLWNWYDRVAWCFEASQHRSLSLDIDNVHYSMRWETGGQQRSVSDDVVERLKSLRDEIKEATIRQIAEALDVQIPDKPPAKYRALTWDQVDALSRRGVSFGPHTLTHPILSQVGDERAQREIASSWEAVSRATSGAVPVFCYPNGTNRDFSQREERLVARAGMKAAVSAVEGYAYPPGNRQLYSLPRFAYSESASRFVQIASGFERLKARVRKN